MSKKLLSMAIAVLILMLAVGSVTVGAADYYEGSNAIAVTADNWSSNRTTSAYDVIDASGLGSASALTSVNNSTIDFSLTLKKDYVFYSGCTYTIKYNFTGNSATGRQGIFSAEGSYMTADKVSNGRGVKGYYTTPAEPTVYENVQLGNKFSFSGNYAGATASGWSDYTFVYENIQFYSDDAYTVKLDNATISGLGLRFYVQNNSSGKPAFSGFTVTETSPMKVDISGDGAVSVNGTAVENGASANVETGAKVVVVFEPADGLKVGSVTYGGNNYQVNNNSITIDKATRFTDLSVTFVEDNDTAVLYESNFNVKDGISSDWAFVSENYWNAGNKELVNKTVGTDVKPAVNMYSINPGAGNAASVFYAENKTGVKVHAGAKYDITYNWYSENITSYNAPFISLGQSGFTGDIYKDGALKQEDIHSQSVMYETFGTNNASSYSEKSASYAIFFEKINESDDGEATMTFGIKAKANARGDNVNYNGIAFGFYNLKIVETSPVSVASSNGSVSVNGTAVENGGKSAYIQTGAPVEFTFTPAAGYEIKSVKYAGQTYDVKDNKLSIANHVVCADLVAEFSKLAPVAPSVDETAFTVSSLENKTITYYDENDNEKTYTGYTIIAYSRLNNYNDGSEPKFGFEITDKRTGNKLTLPCVQTAAPEAAFGVRVIGDAIVEGGEYEFVPVIIE